MDPVGDEQIDVPEEARCLGCGYWLRGLTTPMCPECGRAFDPGDLSTFDHDPRGQGGGHQTASYLGTNTETPFRIPRIRIREWVSTKGARRNTRRDASLVRRANLSGTWTSRIMGVRDTPIRISIRSTRARANRGKGEPPNR